MCTGCGIRLRCNKAGFHTRQRARIRWASRRGSALLGDFRRDSPGLAPRCHTRWRVRRVALRKGLLGRRCAHVTEYGGQVWRPRGEQVAKCARLAPVEQAFVPEQRRGADLSHGHKLLELFRGDWPLLGVVRNIIPRRHACTREREKCESHDDTANGTLWLAFCCNSDVSSRSAGPGRGCRTWHGRGLPRGGSH